MPKPPSGGDGEEVEEEDEEGQNNAQNNNSSEDNNNTTSKETTQPPNDSSAGAIWEEKEPRAVPLDMKTENMDLLEHENAVLALSRNDTDNEVFEHEFSEPDVAPVKKMAPPNSNKKTTNNLKKKKLRDTGQEDMRASDMAFPTDLNRGSQSQPGAFPQRGIGMDPTEDTERDDEENQLSSASSMEAVAAAAAMLGTQPPNLNRQSGLLFSAVLAPNTPNSSLLLPRAQPVNSSVHRNNNHRHQPSPSISSQRSATNNHSSQSQLDGEHRHHHHRENRESAPMATAEPLDEVLLRRKRLTRRVIVYLVMGALLLTGVTVALTMVLDGSASNARDFPKNRNGDTDDDDPAAESASAHDASLIDPLTFAGFHAVEFGFATQGCQEREWSTLELECTGSEEAKTAVFVVDISDNAILCERPDKERNHVTCYPRHRNDLVAFSATVLVGCGSNERFGVAVQATLDVAKAEECAIQVSSLPFGNLGGSRRTVRGETFQWIGIGRFCGTVPYELLVSHTCVQGQHLHLPLDAPSICNISGQLCTSEQDFCFSRGPCTTTKTCTTNEMATCVGGDACDTVVNIVVAADPAFNETCVYTKDSVSEQTSFDFDRGAMWVGVDKIFHYFDDTLPTAIQNKRGGG